MFPAIFVLKYKTQSAGYRASETVLNSRDGLAVKDARLDPADPGCSRLLGLRSLCCLAVFYRVFICQSTVLTVKCNITCLPMIWSTR